MNCASFQRNPIRELQEPRQSRNKDLRFPDPKKDSTLSTGTAVNLSKKTAKRMAAQEVLSKLKASGYKRKGKSLEEVLQSSRKQEPELLGFDETPIKIDDMDNMQPEKLGHQAAEDGSSLSTHCTTPTRTPSKEPTVYSGSEGNQHDEISEGSKSLQEGLQSSCKQEAKLLGSYKTPVKVHNVDNIQLEKLQLQEAEKGSSLASYCTSSRKTLSKDPTVHLGSEGKQHDEIGEPRKDRTNKQISGSAKSRLYEMCAANYWNHPSFVCCKEEELNHIKL